MTQDEYLEMLVSFLYEIGQYQKFEEYLLSKGYSQDEIDDCD